MPLRIPAGAKLLMIGDSITDCGRDRPVGEGRGEAVGKGYVALVKATLGAFAPELGLRIVNMGVSGNTVRDLDARWQTDVLDHRPDWLSVMIGVNDVWRQFDMPQQPERAVQLEDYEAALGRLVERTRPQLQGLVLMAPFYIEPNQVDAMRARMDDYGRAVRRIAERHDAIFVDTQAAFDRVLETVYPATIAWDRVHPDLTGHMVIARAFLEAVGFQW